MRSQSSFNQAWNQESNDIDVSSADKWHDKTWAYFNNASIVKILQKSAVSIKILHADNDMSW